MIVRDHLGKRRRNITIDMEKVYRMIDSGMTVRQVAQSLGVSTDTLYRRHREYQKQAKYLMMICLIFRHETSMKQAGVSGGR